MAHGNLDKGWACRKRSVYGEGQWIIYVVSIQMICGHSMPSVLFYFDQSPTELGSDVSFGNVFEICSF